MINTNKLTNNIVYLNSKYTYALLVQKRLRVDNPYGNNGSHIVVKT